MFSQKLNIVVALLLVVTPAAFSEDWKEFRSSKNFSVEYPGTWFEIGGSSDRLQLLSSQRGAEGVVIKRGQAEIVVLEVPESSGKTLGEVIDYYLSGASVLSRHDIVASAEKEQGCRTLTEVVSTEHAVPSKDSPIPVPYIINTDFFCEADGHKIVTLLRNWKGDARQEQYQQAAMRIAKSIRIEK